jgi:polyhydroxyalkanoate synthesis regulator phasin
MSNYTKKKILINCGMMSLVGLGLLFLTDKNTQRYLRDFQIKGKDIQDKGKQLVDNLDKSIKLNKKILEKKMEIKIQKTLKKFNIPTKKELKALDNKMNKLIKEIKKS